MNSHEDSVSLCTEEEWWVFPQWPTLADKQSVESLAISGIPNIGSGGLPKFGG
jgi:hypothetical protein